MRSICLCLPWGGVKGFLTFRTQVIYPKSRDFQLLTKIKGSAILVSIFIHSNDDLGMVVLPF